MSFLVSSVSHYLPVVCLFPCKQKDENVKGKNGLLLELRLLSPFTIVEASGVSDTQAVMESDGKLRPNSSEVRQRKPE